MCPAPMHVWTGARGLNLAGDSWGDPDAPLVVLLHGGGQTRHAWKGAGERLSALGYHAVAFDARGHGDSEWDSEGYDDDTMAEDLAIIVREMGGSRPILIGASMGGLVSLLAAGEQTIDAAALVLVDVAPEIDHSGAARVQGFMRDTLAGFDSLQAVADSIAAYQPQRPRPERLDGLAKNVRLRDGRYYWHWDPKIVEGFAHAETRQPRLTACAQSLTIPTLLIRGALSDVLSRSGAEAFLEACPTSEFGDVENAAHMVAGDQNDIFVDVVSDFLLRRVPPRSGTVSLAVGTSSPSEVS